MSDELVFHEITFDACQSGDAKLRTSILGSDLPCSHQYLIGSARPLLSRNIGLVLEEDMPTAGEYNVRFIGD
jgi:hypothetical protein